jgi:hypothetical protein
MLKIIMIIIGYTLNNFTIIVDDGKIYNFKIKKQIQFLKINNYLFRQCGN